MLPVITVAVTASNTRGGVNGEDHLIIGIPPAARCLSFGGASSDPAWMIKPASFLMAVV